MTQILLIINYLAALHILRIITDDATWSALMRDTKLGKDLAEQRKITKNEKPVRRMLCWLLIIPGIGMIMMTISLLLNFFDNRE